ncbi:MAG TPA: hypothetical protein VK054_03715 [Beutenbergiaceae bacterium]|nr:hypothetical protein [Beutenbergiaceae bacterium]
MTDLDRAKDRAVRGAYTRVKNRRKRTTFLINDRFLGAEANKVAAAILGTPNITLDEATHLGHHTFLTYSRPLEDTEN